MSRCDDHTSIEDMLSHARETMDLLGETNRERREDNRTLQLALTRLVEIVGEATNRVSKTTQGCHPEILWHKAIGMRNRLIRGYDVTDTDILRDTITSGLPSLIEKLKEKRDTLSVRIRLSGGNRKITTDIASFQK